MDRSAATETRFEVASEACIVGGVFYSQMGGGVMGTSAVDDLSGWTGAIRAPSEIGVFFVDFSTEKFVISNVNRWGFERKNGKYLEKALVSANSWISWYSRCLGQSSPGQLMLTVPSFIILPHKYFSTQEVQTSCSEKWVECGKSSTRTLSKQTWQSYC